MNEARKTPENLPGIPIRHTPESANGHGRSGGWNASSDVPLRRRHSKLISAGHGPESGKCRLNSGFTLIVVEMDTVHDAGINCTGTSKWPRCHERERRREWSGGLRRMFPGAVKSGSLYRRSPAESSKAGRRRNGRRKVSAPRWSGAIRSRGLPSASSRTRAGRFGYMSMGP